MSRNKLLPEDFGIKKGFPHLKSHLGFLADFSAVLRPFTLLPPFLVGIVGSLICWNINLYQTNLLAFLSKTVYVSITLALCQAVGQGINQVTDVEIDRINKPYRPIVSGKLKAEDVMGMVLILLFIAIGRAFTINVNFGILILIGLFLAMFYSLEPIRAKKRLGTNLLWMTISRGTLPMFMIASAWEVDFFNGIILFVAGLSTCWVLIHQSTKDIPDIEGDAEFNIRTLPVVFGMEKTKLYMKIGSILPFLFLFIVLIPPFSMEIGFLIPIFIVLLLFTVFIIRDLEKTGEIFENTKSWIYFYAGLGIIPLVTLIMIMVI